MTETDDTELYGEKRQRIDLYLHNDTENPLVINLVGPVNLVVQEAPETQPGPAVGAIMTIGGNIVGTSSPAVTSITVDEDNQQANIKWVDDKGDTDAAQPPNAAVAWGSDNPAIATVDASSGAITPVAEGSANVTVTVTDNTTGQPFEFNGTALSISPAPIQVVAGDAVGAELTIQAATPPASS